MIRINLLPRKPKPLVTLWKNAAILGCIVFILLVGCMIVMIKMNSRINEINIQIQETRKQIEDSKMDLKKIEKLKKDKAILENKINIIHSLREKQAGPFRMLEQLSLAIPEKVWLDSLVNQQNSLRFEGMAPSYNAVSEFMRKVGESPYFINIELENIQQTMIKGNKFHRFRITCGVNFIPTPPKEEEKAENSTEKKENKS